MATRYDKELGLNSAITRRDFIYGGSLAVGSVVSGCGTERPPVAIETEDYRFAVGEDWYGPGGSGDYASSHGNTPGLVKDAHDIRAGRYAIRPRDAIDGLGFRGQTTVTTIKQRASVIQRGKILLPAHTLAGDYSHEHRRVNQWAGD